MTHINESDVFAIIKNVFTNYNGPGTNSIVAGVEGGDDCGLFKLSPTESIAVTTDFVRGPGFSLFREGHLDWFDLGYYLIVANLSDLAATGVQPMFFTSILRYSKEMSIKDVEMFFEGVKKAQDYFGVPLIGGDTGSYASPVLSATAVGRTTTSNALLRSDVKPQDLLCVTGNIGVMTSALVYFNKLRKERALFTEDSEQQLIGSWKRPPARIKEGLILSGQYSFEGQRVSPHRLAHGCMDISDGLKSSIETLSSLNKIGFTIYGEKIPVSLFAVQIAEACGRSPYDIAMGIAPDFELLFTIPAEKVNECQKYFTEYNATSFTVIGHVNEEGKNLFIEKGETGAGTELPGTAWNHQGIEDYISSFNYLV